MPQTYIFANLVSAETALAGKIKTRRCHTSSRGPQHCCRFSRGANRSAALSFYKSITLGYIIVSTITYCYAVASAIFTVASVYVILIQEFPRFIITLSVTRTGWHSSSPSGNDLTEPGSLILSTAQPIR